MDEKIMPLKMYITIKVFWGLIKKKICVAQFENWESFYRHLPENLECDVIINQGNDIPQKLVHSKTEIIVKEVK